MERRRLYAIVAAIVVVGAGLSVAAVLLLTAPPPQGPIHVYAILGDSEWFDLPAGRHFAPGTEQNLPANGCMNLHRSVRCDGVYWFRLFPLRYWDTTRLPDGRYRLRVRAWDVAGNMAREDVVVTIANDR